MRDRLTPSSIRSVVEGNHLQNHIRNLLGAVMAPFEARHQRAGATSRATRSPSRCAGSQTPRLVRWK
jgi:hypothetical protein